MNYDRFWMVWVEGKLGPTHCHATYADAYAEAEKLARKEQCTAFVLQAVDCLEPQTVIRVTSFRP